MEAYPDVANNYVQLITQWPGRAAEEVEQQVTVPLEKPSVTRIWQVKLRLRPIMMTSLVATFGLLPVAMSHGIGSDSQRPFAIVIGGGLLVALLLGIFLPPTLYVWVAGPDDSLSALEADLEEV